jgi:hypothetical protein
MRIGRPRASPEAAAAAEWMLDQNFAGGSIEMLRDG